MTFKRDGYQLTAVAVVVILAVQSRHLVTDGCFVGPTLGYGHGIHRHLAVASKGKLEFMTSDGNVTTVESRGFKELTAVTYDPAQGYMYVTDASHYNGSIFQLNLATSKIIPLVEKQRMRVQGIAYDPVSTALYWTNGYGKEISMLSFATTTNSPKPVVLHQFYDEIPMGIAIDNCKRFLYWTNSNHLRPTIERSLLDGTKRETIVEDDLFQPLGIAVDQLTNKLYWSDDREGMYYKIERSDLDGTHRKTLLHGTHHQPYSLTVGPNFIYWSDWVYNAVWSLPKNGEGHEPTQIKQYHMELPMGLVAQISTDCHKDQPVTSKDVVNSTSVDTNDDSTEEYMGDDSTTISIQGDFEFKYCLNNGTLKDSTSVCSCPPGYDGDRCEKSACFNYCVYGNGSCELDTQGFPQCSCQLGYKGARCHVDVCEDYCLNGGRCTVLRGDKPMCKCGYQYKGQRCERSREPSLGHYVISGEVENTTSSVLIDNITTLSLCDRRSELNEVFVIGLGSVIFVQFVILVVLARKVCVLRKRPRIKKRIIVNKNVTPLTSRPPQQGEQCEITIENCCNMNICETPCFEPQLRTSKTLSKTEEKKNLLGSMEESQSCSPCQDDLY